MSRLYSKLPDVGVENIFDAIYLHKCWLAARTNGQRMVMHFVTIAQIDFRTHSLKNASFFGCNFKNNKLSPQNLKEATFKACHF